MDGLEEAVNEPCVIKSGRTDCQYYCSTHDCRMGGSGSPPKSCFKLRPLTSGERKWLIKEQRRFGFREIVGTMSRDDVRQLDEIKALLRS